MALDVTAVLIECVVYDPLTATTKTLRFTNRNDPRATTYNALEWRPLITKSPTIGVSVFNGAFTAAGVVELEGFQLALSDPDLDAMVNYTWHGAKVTIWTGNLQTNVFTQLFVASGDGATRAGRSTLQIDLTTRNALLDRAVLYLGYAGTGDIEGEADIKGVPKPFVLGEAKFCKPTLIDSVRQIYQVHGYGPVESIYAVFEGGAAIGTGGNPAASLSGTYAAFRDTAVAQGQWIRHNNLGLIKLGSQPSFPITCHVKGDTGGVNGGAAIERAGSQAKRLINLIVSTVTVNAASAAALDAAVPYDLNDYYDEQLTLPEALEKLLMSVGGYWTWNSLGEVIFGLVRFGASAMTLSAKNDQLPTVLGVNQLPTSAPVWSFRMGAEECHFVHDASSIVQSLVDLQTDIDTGLAGKNKTFPPGATPPVGAIEGDLWPDTSTTPNTMRRYNATTSTWIVTSNLGAQTGQNLVNNAGSILTQGAVVTGEGISAGISGQGSGATANNLTQLNATEGTKLTGVDPGATAGGNHLPNGALALDATGWSLSTATRVAAGATDPVPAYVHWTATTAVVTPLSDATVAQGNRMSVQAGETLYFGQVARGDLTLSNNCRVQWLLSWYDATGAVVSTLSPVLQQFAAANTWETRELPFTVPANAVSLRARVQATISTGATYVDAGLFWIGRAQRGATIGATAGTNLYQTNGTTVMTQGDVRTIEGVSSGFTGQGALATRGDVYFGSTYLLEASGGAQASLSNFKTLLGIAAGFTGQGPWSTFSDSVATIQVPSPNLIKNSNFRLGLYGWTLSAINPTVAHTNYGDYLQAATARWAQSPRFVLSAVNYTFQWEYWNDAAAEARVYYFTAAGAANGDSGAIVVPAGTGSWTRQIQTLIPAANTAFGEIRFTAGASTARIRKVKAEIGTTATVYTEDLTDGARYGDASTIDSLQPSELGSNVTETRIASGILSQGALATLNAVNAGRLALASTSNLLLDPTLADTTYWNANDNWTLIDSATGGAFGNSVRYYLQSAAGNGTTSQAAAVYRHTAQLVAVEAGKPYRAFARTHVQTGFTGVLYISVLFYKADGVTPSAINSGTNLLGTDYRTVACPSTITSLIDGQVTVPSDASWAMFRLLLTWSTTLNNAQLGFMTAPFFGRAIDGDMAIPLAFRLNRHLAREDGTTYVTDAAAITSLGTAGAITGQGALATRSDVYFGDVSIKETSGGVTATLANFKTSSGTAAAISGQGSLATRGDVYFGSAFLLEASGGSQATLANFKTSSGISAGFSGQGTLATLNQVGSTEIKTGVMSDSKVLNGGAESGDIDGWKKASGTATATVTATSADKRQGVYAFALTKVATGDNVSAQSKGFPVVPGKTYNVHVSLKGSSATATGIYVRMGGGTVLDSAGFTTVTTNTDMVANGPITTSWDDREYTYTAPAGIFYCSLMIFNFTNGPTTVWFDEAQVYERVGSLGLLTNAVQLGLNITRADGSTSLTDALAVTSLGTAAAITSQGALATRGDVFFGDPMIKEASGGATATLANFKTSSGTAAAITSQGWYATANSVSLEDDTRVTNKTRISKLSASTGVATNSSILPANTRYSNISALKDVVTLSDTDNTGTVTINIGAAVYYPDSGSTVTFASGSVVGCAYNTKYYIKRVGVDPVSQPTGTGWNASTTLTIGVGDVYINYFVTRVNGGTPPPPPPPPPGGGQDCVSIYAFVELADGSLKLAKDVVAGDELRVLDYGTMRSTTTARVERAFFSWEPQVRLVTAEGGELTLSTTTPVTLRSGEMINVKDALGKEIPVLDRRHGPAVLRWERIEAIADVPSGCVAHIMVGGATYAAGNRPDFMLLTHNPSKP